MPTCDDPFLEKWHLMTMNGIRSRWSLNGNEWQSLVTLAEPTPNREQRVLAHFAEVRRRKTVGQWHSLVTLDEWQMRLPLSTPIGVR